MSIFSGLRSYEGKWQVKSVNNFTPEDKALVANATVVTSQYGLSVCFMMKAGNMHFIPVDQNSPVSPGDQVDLDKAQVVTLGKEGEEDIERVRIL